MHQVDYRHQQSLVGKNCTFYSLYSASAASARYELSKARAQSVKPGTSIL